ncbi:hypothetical protein [uncultured Bacteroides sp.]|uniref:hypothetical protein n=1 Tax=uncultured Bacteroides sp. TaxID=162156 RepID=UPI00280AA140|nr:hypothetical protein [uncultured Bacteroides sp.]
MVPVIDKLKICYTLSDTSKLHELRENLLERFEVQEWDFHLRRIEGKHFSNVYEIVYIFNKDNNPEDMEEQVFGTIQWGLRSDHDEAFKPYVWLYVDNSQFYLKYDYSTNGRLMFLGYIEQMLGLVFNNITHLDLALDSSTNYSKALIKLIRDKDYYPIINGSKITDRKKLIEDILYIGVGNLERIKEYSLLIQQKKNDLSLNSYNKKREVENKSKKFYIMDRYKNPNQLHRLEIRINSDVLKDFFIRNRIEYNPSMFITDDWLWLLFLTFLNRIIRFQTVKGRKVYGVMDLI